MVKLTKKHYRYESKAYFLIYLIVNPFKLDFFEIQYIEFYHSIVLANRIIRKLANKILKNRKEIDRSVNEDRYNELCGSYSSILYK